MHGLEKTISLEFMLGRELVQVAVGAHQVILNFDRDTSVTIEGLCEFGRNGGISYQVHGDSPKDTCQLTRLLQSTITAATNHGDGSVTLEFSNGQYLRIIDSNERFESYSISAPDVATLVV